ncbi:MAG: ParB N-terminal domain-containing protein [Solobacterium sp.]|nr:ParB N-terminal domain-containing protein [Solobacterium sp.]
MINEFTEKIRRQKIFLFGTGFVAEMFYRALELNGLESGVEGCIVSSEDYLRPDFHGLPVYTAAMCAGRKELVCIAVHEANRESAEIILKEHGIHDYVWIYPMIYPLVYGDVQEERNIPLQELMMHQNTEYYWIEARYSAAVEHTKEHPDYNIYRKAIALHTSPRTAEYRLQKMLELIRGFERCGYDPQYPILIDDQFRIIDGLHRAALCIWNEIEEIPCRIVKASKNYELLLDDRNFLPEKKLKEYGFTAEEIQRLHDYHKLMEKKYR